MKTTRIPFIVLLSTVFVAVLPTQAYKVWTLEECINTAKDSNIQVQRQQLQVEAAKSNFQAAQAGRLPSVSGWFSHNLSSGKTVNYEDYTYINTQYQDGNMGIQGTLPLFDGLKGWNLIRQSKYGLMSEKEKTEAL